ncbi:MAG: TolC family protein [Deltaproteobacteria bacterium]|nr:TolC family protein [Deltaproteobacteria bacterium]
MNTRSSISARIYGSVVAILLLILAARATFAESRQPEDDKSSALLDGTKIETRVTWNHIVRLAEEHPQIGASQHRVAAAHAAVDAAGAVPNPSLEATTAYGQAIDNSASKVEWGLSLSIPLGWIAQRRARINAADAGASLEEAQAMALRRDVLLQLRVLFWTLVYQQERVTALIELDNQMSSLASTVKLRVEKGEVRPVEAMRVEVEAEKVAGELEVAGLALAASSKRLAVWLGVRDSKRLVAEANLNQLPEPITPELARQRAGRHPILDAAKAREQSLAASVTVERRARVPSIAVEVFTDHELDRSAYGVGLAIDLPLWNWNTANIQRSEHLLAAQRKSREVELLELETLAIEVLSKCRAGVVLATRYNESILPGAQSAAQAIERTYQIGEASLLEVIDARRTLLDTKRQFLSALADAQINCSRLHAIVGKELL